jgi:hypothetical protein
MLAVLELVSLELALVVLELELASSAPPATAPTR